MSEIKKVNGKTVFKRFISYEQDKEFIKNTEINEAREEGSYESKIEIAKNLLENDIDIKTISNSTGLSIDEINRLK